jgi:carbamoyl-phosphate synthase large subunit
MKNILITAGGTASAYYFCKTISKYLKNEICLFVADINEEKLIPAAMFADQFIQVPLVSDATYKDAVLNEIDDKNIDIIVPLIDLDLMQFPRDDEGLAALNCISTAPELSVSQQLSDKIHLTEAASRIGVNVPRDYTTGIIDPNLNYFTKPRLGFGSRDAIQMSGLSILENDSNSDMIIQEVCDGPEVTVEVFYDGDNLHTLCRERLEVKAGVCTKARVFQDAVLHEYIDVIARHFILPTASCFQFMKNQNGEWCLTDANLRIGAGSALCAAVGWNLPYASVLHWIGRSNEANEQLDFIGQDRYVVRVYEEIVTV